MNRSVIRSTLAATLLLAGLCNTARADLQASLESLGTYQVGTTGIVRFGTVVAAHTNLNAIWASANYRIECSDPAIRPPITGGRGWSEFGLVGPQHIFVTAPALLPAEQELPGWQAVMGGTYLTCVNTQTGYAKTHILPIGNSGTAFPIGGDYWEESVPVTFGMIKPGTSFGGGCIF